MIQLIRVQICLGSLSEPGYEGFADGSASDRHPQKRKRRLRRKPDWTALYRSSSKSRMHTTTTTTRQRRAVKETVVGTATTTSATTTTTPLTTVSSRPRVVIVGGGPAGAATAKALADRQLYDVELFEAYPHPNKISRNNARKAYVIALSGRGQRGLQNSTKIDPSSIPQAIVSKSLVRHPRNKTMDHSQQPSVIIPRKYLTAHLLDQAERAGATVHWQQRLVELDLVKRVAVFQSEEKKEQAADDGDNDNDKSVQHTRRISYDLLIGADGSNSLVRAVLDQQADDFAVVRQEQDSMEYQVAVLNKNPFPFFSADAVHVWNDKKYNSICLAFPLHTGGMLLAPVFPQGQLEEFKKAQEATGKGYDHALECLMPDVSLAVRAEISQQLAYGGEPANGGLCVWTSALGSSQHGVVLVGDSGHGMWPSLGQGANAALETVAVFCRAVDNVQHTLYDESLRVWTSAVVEKFTALRHEDALAAVDLTYGGIGARKSRGRENAPVSFKLQVVGIMLLHKLSFGIFPKPAMLRIMSGDDIRYSTARRYNFFYEKFICIGALVGCCAVAVYLGCR